MFLMEIFSDISILPVVHVFSFSVNGDQSL
jgi:hypothetical protein